MKREIKFRAWHIPTKRMFNVFSCGQDAIFEDSIDGIGTSPTLPAEAKDCDLMQYTGLKDKNGKEIYEGDIVKDRFNRIMKVGYWNYRLCWIAISKTNFHHADFYDWEIKGEVTDDNDMGYTGKFSVQVIGNIHENPKLLK